MKKKNEENETLMDSDGWKGDTEQQDGNEKETPIDSISF